MNRAVVRMVEWLPKHSSLGMVLHDSKFHVQLKDDNGAIRSLRRIHVKDLRDEQVGRLSVPGYAALSAAFNVLHAMSDHERWRVLIGTTESPHLLCVYAHDEGAVVAMTVCAVQGRDRFIAVIRDSGCKGLESRLALQDMGCNMGRAVWTDRQR
jgi:hypothetical protein